VNIGPGIRAISADTPPSTVPRESNPKRPVHPGNADAPSGPGVVVNVKAPGRVTRVIIGAVPGPVVPASAVNNGATVVVAAVIGRRVTHVDDFGCHIVNTHVGDVMVWVRRRDIVNRVRHVGGYSPGPFRAVRLVPDAIVTSKIEIAVLEYSGWSIKRILDLDILDRCEVRISVVFHTE